MSTTTTEPQSDTITPTSPHAHALMPWIAAAFALVYLAWGCTFYGIRVAIETIPVFVMAGTRFFIAGAILMVGLRFFQPKGFHWGTRREWRDATVVGGLLIVIGNGGMTLSERTLPSGIAALITAGTPLWMVLFDWLRPGGRRPTGTVAIGLLLGFGGILILCQPEHAVTTVASPQLWGYLVLIGANICWGAGAIYSRHTHVEGSPLLPVARQMLMGGLLLFAIGVGTGELHRFSLGAVSLRSALGFAYLLVFGSLLGYTAYVWLMKVSTPARVGTVSYVNPIIAVLVGWAMGGEALTLKIALSAAIIIIAVVIVIRR